MTISELYQECRDHLHITIGTIGALTVIEPHKDLEELRRILTEGATILTERHLAALEKERQGYQKQSALRGEQWRD